MILNSLKDINNTSLQNKVTIFQVGISLFLVVILIYIFSIYVEKTDRETYARIDNSLKSLVTERIEVKRVFGLSNAISIASNEIIANSLKTGNRKPAFILLNHIIQDMMEATKYGDIKVHVHTVDNHSFIRNWQLKQYGDDLSSFRKTVVQVNATKKPINSFEAGREGLRYRSVIIVKDNKNKHVGSLEFIQAMDPVARAFDKNSHDGFLLLMNHRLRVKNSYETEALFNYDISQKFVNQEFLKDAKNIDMRLLLKQGFYIGEKYYFTYKNVIDFQNKKLGIFLLGRDLEIVHNTVKNRKEMIQRALFAGILMIFLGIASSLFGLRVLILKPLKELDTGLKSFFDFLQKKSDSTVPIDIHTKDEFGQIAKSVNENIAVSKKLHQEIIELNNDLEKKIEQRTKEIVEKNEVFEAIYKGSKDAIAIVDLKSNFLKVNPAYMEMTGFNEEELLKTSCLALTIEEDRELTKTAMDEVNNFGFIKNFEKACITKDNKVITTNMSMSLLYDKQRILMSVRDITQNKELERTLIASKLKAEESVKAKSNFLANMSHEIRTPMNGILGMTHLVKQTKLDSKQMEYVHKIHIAANNLLNIINDILDFSKIEAGKLKIEEINFDMNEVIKNIKSLLENRAYDKGLKCNLFYLEKNSIFFGDSLRISQVFINLLSNAIKFTDDGEINLSIEYLEDDMVRFIVSDTGIGITDSQINILFNPFDQADASTTRKYGGTGLGLSISKELVELMHGKIWVESQEGVGSRFIFEIRLPKGSVSEIDTVAMENVNINDKIMALEINTPRHDISDEMRAELFSNLKIAAKSSRPINCALVMEDLQKYNLSDEDKKIFNEVNNLIKKYKFKEILEILES